MKNGNGFISRIVLNANNSAILWKKIKPYMKTKFLKPRNTFREANNGIPSKYWIEVINSRLIQISNRGESIYRNDDGKQVIVNWKQIKAPSQIKFFSYNRWDRNDYEEFLKNLKLISQTAYDKLVKLIKLRYKLIPITNIRKGKIEKVYDISMAKGVEPAFIANGLVVHNTHENFAKALQQNRRLKSLFSTNVTITLEDYSGVNIFDVCNLKVYDLVTRSKNMPYSGDYIVASKTRFLNRERYCEMITMSTTGPNYAPSSLGLV
jgi:hypothetical protein